MNILPAQSSHPKVQSSLALFDDSTGTKGISPHQNKGCKGDLECGSNNCKKFSLYFHEKDDCCEKPSNKSKKAQNEKFVSGLPLEPKEGGKALFSKY